LEPAVAKRARDMKERLVEMGRENRDVGFYSKDE
jgi:hypothetical protein